MPSDSPWFLSPIFFAVLAIIGGGILLIAAAACCHVKAQYERAVIFRLGRFSRVVGPGFFITRPLIEYVEETVDIRTTPVRIQIDSALTRDTVPLEIEAELYYHVLDSDIAVQHFVIAVDDAEDAINRAALAALRAAVGQHDLADLLGDQQSVDEAIAKAVGNQAEAWGIVVERVQILDIQVPQTLTDAMSRQAQAQREAQARIILAASEKDAAQAFIDAAKMYDGVPNAIHLRGMNMLYEALKEKGAIVVVPSSAVNSMDLGSAALLGKQLAP